MTAMRQALAMLDKSAAVDGLADLNPADYPAGPEGRRTLGRALLLEGRASVQLDDCGQAIPAFFALAKEEY